MHSAMVCGRGEELPLLRGNTEIQEVVLCPQERLRIAHCQSKCVLLVDCATRPRIVLVLLQRPVTPEDPAEIASAIRVALHWPFSKGPSAHELVVDREVRSLLGSRHGSGDMLPPALSYKSMMPAHAEGR